MQLRKSLRGKISMIVPKNRIAKRGLKESGLPNIEQFIEALQGQHALIFTSMSPFELSLILDRNKVNLPAKAGDIATQEIVVSAGNTGIPPGPILSEFRELGVPTRIDSGSVWIAKDSVVAKPGSEISSKLAGLLSRLGLKPIQAGLSLSLAYDSGLILKSDQLRLDLGSYVSDLAGAYSSAFALAVNTGYPLPDALRMNLMKASMEAAQLATSAAYLTDESVGVLLGKAQGQASALSAKAGSLGYSAST
jgi:large subunit ribosomal protein L10